MSIPTRQTDAELGRLLRLWSLATGAERAAVEAELREVFEETGALFVLDMSRFSSMVMKHGILQFLTHIHAMRGIAVPRIHAGGGQVVKYVGDNIIALFHEVAECFATAVDIVLASHETDFRVSIGIGFGALLHVPRTDVWGHEANLAFKLGEDVAGPSEILLSAAAFQALPAAQGETCTRLAVSVSGLELSAYSRALGTAEP